MTGREKIEAALSNQGTKEFPAVICYEGIYIRDHWQQLTDCPWWFMQSPKLAEQLQWRRDVIEKTGQDWFYLPVFFTRQQQARLYIEEHNYEVYRIDRQSGVAKRLRKPEIGGWEASIVSQSVHPDVIADSSESVAACIPVPESYDLLNDGREDLAKALLQEYGQSLYPIVHVSSPLWQTYNLWGFEGMMTMIATRPDLVRFACERYLALNKIEIRQAAELGAAAIWIEDCMMDMLSPRAFAELHLPFLVRLVEDIRSFGLKSIHYFCGNPVKKWNMLLATGADALSLEEGKKGFSIDIEEVVAHTSGRITVLGNLDAINLLTNGDELALRKEIDRQLRAGIKNSGRFIMSTGSPVTPFTHAIKIRKYCDLVHSFHL